MTFREWLVWIFVDRCSPSRRGIRLGKKFAKDFNRGVQNAIAGIMGFAEGMREFSESIPSEIKERKNG